MGRTIGISKLLNRRSKKEMRKISFLHPFYFTGVVTKTIFASGAEFFCTNLFVNLFLMNEQIEKDKKLFLTLIIMIFIILLQYILIPSLYFNSNVYYDQFNNCLLLLFISMISGVITQSDQLRLNKQILETDEIKKDIAQREIIAPNLQDNNIKQSFNNLLNCNSELDFMSLQITDPESFYNDQSDIIAYQIYSKSSEFISKAKLQELKNKINHQNIQILSKITNIKLKFQQDKIKQFQLNSVSVLEIKDMNGIRYDYNYFINLLDQVKLIQNKIRRQNFIINFDKLLEIKDIDSSSNIYYLNKKNSDTYVLNNNISLFKNTKLSKLINIIKTQNKQDLLLDKQFTKIQQESITDNSNVEIKNCKNEVNNITKFIDKDNFNTKSIQRILENKLEIESYQFNDENISYFKFDKSIQFKVLQAEDKLLKNVITKISSKKEQNIDQNIPWFQNLVNDIKRMSIVFKNQYDLQQYFNKFKILFGQDLSKTFENENIFANIIKIKNGFKDQNIESNSQVDIKVIIEFYHKDRDIAQKLEIQLNLEIPILFKKTDHLLQDQQRYDNIVKLKNEKINLFKFEESQFKQFLILFKNILAIISISLFITTFIITFNHQFNKNTQNIIECQRGIKNCYLKCMKDIEIRDECIQYQINYNNELSFNESIRLSTKQNQYNQSVLENSKQLFLEFDLILNQSWVQYFISKNNDLKYCKDIYNNSSILNLPKDRNKLIYDGHNYAYLDIYNNFIQNISYFNENIKDHINNFIQENNISDFQFNFSTLCIKSDSKKIYCSKSTNQISELQPNHDGTISTLKSNFENNLIQSNYNFIADNIILQNIKKVGINNIAQCVIKLNNKLICQYKVNVEISTPEKLKNLNIISLKCSIQHICILSENNSLFCWGISNYFGETDIPQDTDQHFTQIQIDKNITCALDNYQKIQCFGQLYTILSEQEKKDVLNFAVSLNALRFLIQQSNYELIQQTLDDNFLKFSQVFGKDQTIALSVDVNILCFILKNDNMLMCFDILESNIDVEVPDNFKHSLFLSTIYNDTICAVSISQNGICYGAISQYEAKKQQNESLLIDVDKFQLHDGVKIYLEQNNKIYEIENDSDKLIVNIQETERNYLEILIGRFIMYFLIDRIKYYLNENETIEFLFDTDQFSYGVGQNHICIHFIDQSLKCYDSQTNIYTFDSKLKENVQMQSVHAREVCIFNQQMEIQCQLIQEDEYIQNSYNKIDYLNFN